MEGKPDWLSGFPVQIYCNRSDLISVSYTHLDVYKRQATIEELDEAVLNRLISKILIGEVKKLDGQKVLEVRIVYNFVGEIPEITT